MTKKKHQTKLLDELEDGPWPSFVTGLKRLADDDGTAHGDMMKDLLGQLEHSYETRRGYWKGGTVGVYGYGGGVIPRFSELTDIPFTRHHIDDYRGGRESLNVSTHIHF